MADDKKTGPKTGKALGDDQSEKTENFFEKFKLNVDPENIDESFKQLGEKLRSTVDTGRYTRVRLLYRGKQIGPDIPMAAMLAGEVAAFWLAGPLRALIVNLGVRSFIEVELIHAADELVHEGIELYLDGEVDEAEAKYREALSKKADDAAALYNLGVLLRVTGRRSQAAECFEKAAEREGHPDAIRAREALDKMKKGPRTL